MANTTSAAETAANVGRTVPRRASVKTGGDEEAGRVADTLDVNIDHMIWLGLAATRELINCLPELT
jgi:hypothetical protein